MMLRPFTALMIACALPGCAYHSLTVPVPNRGDQNLHPVDSNAIVWGALEDPKKAEACVGTNSISDVQVRTSLMQSLATVLTLGFSLREAAHLRRRNSAIGGRHGAHPEI
jgi:hypothetical protein